MTPRPTERKIVMLYYIGIIGSIIYIIKVIFGNDKMEIPDHLKHHPWDKYMPEHIIGTRGLKKDRRYYKHLQRLAKRQYRREQFKNRFR